jgi:hypothetical protein
MLFATLQPSCQSGYSAQTRKGIAGKIMSANRTTDEAKFVQEHLEQVLYAEYVYTKKDENKEDEEEDEPTLAYRLMECLDNLIVKRIQMTAGGELDRIPVPFLHADERPPGVGKHFAETFAWVDTHLGKTHSPRLIFIVNEGLLVQKALVAVLDLRKLIRGSGQNGLDRAQDWWIHSPTSSMLPQRLWTYRRSRKLSRLWGYCAEPGTLQVQMEKLVQMDRDAVKCIDDVIKNVTNVMKYLRERHP